MTHFHVEECLESILLIKHDHYEVRGYKGDLGRNDPFLPLERSCSALQHRRQRGGGRESGWRMIYRMGNFLDLLCINSLRNRQTKEDYLYHPLVIPFIRYKCELKVDVLWIPDGCWACLHLGSLLCNSLFHNFIQDGIEREEKNVPLIFTFSVILPRPFSNFVLKVVFWLSRAVECFSDP